jgi:hypothetical protein
LTVNEICSFDVSFLQYQQLLSILFLPYAKLDTHIDFAQRLVAQAHGHFREAATILAGFLQLQFGVLSLSLGHVACSHLLGHLFV